MEIINPIIEVTPLEALFDEEVTIKISSLLANDEIKITGKMVDQFGNIWQSYAVFKANTDGEILVTEQIPIKGTYQSTDSMGLFWSMQKIGKVNKKKESSLTSMLVELAFFYKNELVHSVILKRNFISKEIARKSIQKNGLVGTLFYPKDEHRRKGMIYLGGSEGGLTERRAAMIASHGYTVLALGYFGMETLPPELVEIPIEYVQHACNWLLSQEVVDSRLGITVIGISKGGELALLAASHFKEISSVVAIVPSSIVYPGLGPTYSSSWSYNSKPYPFASSQIPEELLNENKNNHEQGRPIQYRKTYLSLLQNENVESDAFIPVEKIQGDILLISGDDDQLWPSDVHCHMIMDRLREKQFPNRYKHLKYKGAGHSFYLPYWPTTDVQYVKYGSITMDLGGNDPKITSHSQTDAWLEMLKFLNMKSLLK